MAKEEIDIQAERQKIYAKREAKLEKEKAERDAADERGSPTKDSLKNSLAVRATDGGEPGTKEKNPIVEADKGTTSSEDEEPRINASKAAIDHAEANGIDIKDVIGTGKDGAITKPDVDNHIAALNQ